MNLFPAAMQRLINELSRLPSIGEKSATRLANHLVSNDKKLAATLSEALKLAHEQVKLCQRCFFFSEQELCHFCRNTSRDTSILCVVEKPIDVISVEKTGDYRGLYHVLHGLWAPLRGQGTDSMRLKELSERLKSGEIKEVVMALGATVEGDATSLYVARALNELGIQVTRLAQGMPKGGELEYADEVTLSRAFAGRAKIG